MLNFLFSNIVFGLSLETKNDNSDEDEIVECSNCNTKFEFDIIEEHDFICPVCNEELEIDDDVDLSFLEDEIIDLRQNIEEMKHLLEEIKLDIEDLKKND